MAVFRGILHNAREVRAPGQIERLETRVLIEGPIPNALEVRALGSQCS